jgi:hypothetical protein
VQTETTIHEVAMLELNKALPHSIQKVIRIVAFQNLTSFLVLLLSEVSQMGHPLAPFRALGAKICKALLNALMDADSEMRVVASLLL